MARKKQAALDVPNSREEAIELATEYVSADRRMLELKVGYELQIDALKSERDRVLAGIAAEQHGRFQALKAWWEAGGKALAGRGRSATLAGALLGIRKTPPAVKFAKGVKAEAVVKWLSSVTWLQVGERHELWLKAKDFLRTKVELDKPAIIKAAPKEVFEDAFAGWLTVVQADEFFIDTGLTEEDARQRLGVANSAGEVA